MIFFFGWVFRQSFLHVWMSPPKHKLEDLFQGHSEELVQTRVGHHGARVHPCLASEVYVFLSESLLCPHRHLKAPIAAIGAMPSRHKFVLSRHHSSYHHQLLHSSHDQYCRMLPGKDLLEIIGRKYPVI